MDGLKEGRRPMEREEDGGRSLTKMEKRGKINHLQLILLHPQCKLYHKTTFFGHAILSKQLCLHSFCLFEGMQNILKYMQIS